MHNIDPLLGPSFGQQQQHMRFSPMIVRSSDQRSRHYQPYYHPRIHPPRHYALHLNDGRPSPPQSINNTYVPTTTSNQQINILNLDPGAQSDELQTNVFDSQRQSLLNDLKTSS